MQNVMKNRHQGTDGLIDIIYNPDALSRQAVPGMFAFPVCTGVGHIDSAAKFHHQGWIIKDIFGIIPG
jgi:hypothetical protein